MKKAKQLMTECKRRNYNCSIGLQKGNDYSVEIYTGHKSNYNSLFFTDGHLKPKKAIKKALKWVMTFDVSK